MTRQIWLHNRQNIEKNRPQKTKEAQNVAFNMKGRIPLLFYSVKHIHGQFKTNKTLYGALTRWGYTTDAHYC